MTPGLNVLITIGARDAQRDAYAVQLQHEGKPLADIWARIDRQALLEDEHKFSARDYGMELYDVLFTGAVGRAYQRLIGQADAETAIRVQLVIHPDAPELHALPWERLFHVFGDGETPLAASAQTPFSRFLVSGAGDQPPAQERSLRLLVAIANPTGLPDGCSPLDVTGEVACLAEVLVGLSGPVQGTLLAGRSGLPDDLRQRLTQQGWTIHDGVTSWQAIQRWVPAHHALHVLAHGQFKAGESPGKGTAYLLLEHEGGHRVARGAVDCVPDDEIVTGLAGVHPLPQLICLAACDTAKRPSIGGANPFVGLAPKLVAAGVPAVVAMQDEVPIDLARTVAADFYRRLFEHGQVDRALNEARSLVYEANQFAWAIPVLFLRLRGGRIWEPLPPRLDFEPETVYIPAGPFLMGADPGPGIRAYETPQHTVTLPAYRIGKYPVTNAQYLTFVRQTRHPVAPETGWVLAPVGQEPPPGRENHPVVGITWDDAVAYCHWLSDKTGRRYRLPSEAEWEKAARGTDGRLYPWGDESDPVRCNCAESGNGGTTRAGAYSRAGDSPYGCADMAGNVWEWTSTRWGNERPRPAFAYPYDPADGREDPTRDVPYREYRIYRGRSYRDVLERAACAARAREQADVPDAARGFRVVLDME